MPSIMIVRTTSSLINTHTCPIVTIISHLAVLHYHESDVSSTEYHSISSNMVEGFTTKTVLFSRK